MVTIATILIIIFAVALVLGLIGLALGLVVGIAGLVIKLLPLILIVVVVAFFVMGGRVERSEDGNSSLNRPDAWRKHHWREPPSGRARCAQLPSRTRTFSIAAM